MAWRWLECMHYVHTQPAGYVVMQSASIYGTVSYFLSSGIFWLPVKWQ